MKRRAPSIGLALGSFTLASAALAAPPAPSGAHPRLFLDATTLAAMKSQQADSSSGTARAFAACKDARDNPGDHTAGGTWAFDWGFVATACGLAYQVGGAAEDASTGITYLNALLDDYQQIGDAAGGDDVVQHDTGYSMRNYASYAGIAYDWLHDAPGMDDALRAHARARFKAWTDWYGQSGYLRDMAGANYNAGYVFAATMIAVAEAGEAGADGDALWAHVIDDIFGDVLARGLTESPGDPASDQPPGGVLLGGDWAEGWQYGPLSVIEYALSARAVEEQGVAQPGMDAWAGELVVRSLYATNPAGTGLWVGGDFDSEEVWQSISTRTLLATLVGPASAQSQEWARAERARVGGHDEAIFEALADAKSGATTPFPTATMPTTLWITGTHTLFTRDKWDASAVWAMFRAGPRMVADHEHSDSGNWALSRGQDDVIVDPSPYGSRSTLTSNAPAADSNLVGDEYHPSQTPWNAATEMTWRRVASNGVVVARGDYHDAYRFRENDSDVPVALRDWILIPVGGDAAVVVLDRVVTGQAARGMHLRVRTKATLTLAGDVATGSVGGSGVAIRRVWSSSGTPAVTTPPQGDCGSGDFGKCSDARFAVQQLELDVAGPNAAALHVVDAYASGGAVPGVASFEGTGHRGISFVRGGEQFVVVFSDAPDGAPGSTLTYTAPAPSENIVVDAPTDGSGQSDVTATPVGADCQISVVPHAGGTALDGKPLMFDLSSSCEVTEVGTGEIGVDAGTGGIDAAGGSASGGTSGAGASGGVGGGAAGSAGAGASGGSGSGGSGASTGAQPASGDEGGCGCRAGGRQALGWSPLGVGVGLLLLLRVRSQRSRRRRIARAQTA